MKKEYLLIGIFLLISLFIYVFYRTGTTVVNKLVVCFISPGAYTSLKAVVVSSIPLSNVVIYSIPEGLWMLCITMTSKPFYFIIFGKRMNCLYIPLIFCISLEILQLFQVTNGQFDYIDIVIFVPFWLLGRYALPIRNEQQNIFTSVNTKTFFCLGIYGIVYLAHVIN
jgi:hypothetical protein